MAHIYIAAKYGRRFDLRAVAQRLQQEGHTITSTWLWDDEPNGDKLEAHALRDCAEVRAADAVIFVGEPQASENRGGGRWFEFGFGYALGKVCICWLSYKTGLGGHDHLPAGHESVFTGLPDVHIARTDEDLIRILNEECYP